MATLIRRAARWQPLYHVACRRYCRHEGTNVRVRFAPSPTGEIHLGGLRTALYNYLFAKSHGGTFILRAEDTDRTRFVPGATEKIIEILDWSGLKPDEGPSHGGSYGPYYQSHRLQFYEEKAQRLIDSDFAYKCFCSGKRLDLVRKDAMRRGEIPKYDNKCRHLSSEEIQQKNEAKIPYTIRFKLESMTEPWNDLIHGPIHQNVAMIEGDPIIMKSDGFPTYHFACVVDDHSMEISHVLRGEEWMASTAKHVLLHRAFGWTPPKFAHLPLLLNSDGTKLSKRQGDIGVETLRNKGYYPEAVLNLLTKAGAGFVVKDTLGLNLPDLVENFRLEKLSPSSGRLQLEHLESINRVHLKKRLLDSKSESAEKLRNLIRKAGEHYTSMNEEERTKFLERALVWGQARINRVEDLLDPGFRFLWFEPEVDCDWLRGLPIDQSQVLLHAIQALEDSSSIETSELTTILKSIVSKNGYKMAHFMKVLRMALCGLKQGPPVAEVMTLLGREEVLKRLNKCHGISEVES